MNERKCLRETGNEGLYRKREAWGGGKKTRQDAHRGRRGTKEAATWPATLLPLWSVTSPYSVAIKDMEKLICAVVCIAL